MPYPVECVGHINFNNHTLVSPFPAGMNCFLHQYNVFYHLSFFHEATLVWGDEFMKERFDSIGYDFSYELIRNIAEGDGSKSREGGWVQILWDKSQKSGICITPQLCGFLNILYHPQEISFYYMPTLLVKMHTETIWSWSFVWMKLEQGLMELFFYNFLIDLVVILLIDNTWDV